MTTVAHRAAPPLAGASTPPRPDLELPSLVMRRALWVAAACLVLLLLLGLRRAGTDTLREMEGSLDLARVAQVLAGLREAPLDEGLRRLGALPGLRHLELVLRDENGAEVYRIADEDSDAWLLRQWRRVAPAATRPRVAPEVAYGVPLRDGRVWTAVLSASPDSEILESASNLAGLFVLMLGCCAAMLAAMHWNVRRALRPLRTLVDAIAGVERHELEAVKALPAMPVRELDAIAQALRHLAAAQERSETGRRVLAHRLMSLQEDERQRLARELHDEFGQRLTALRVDASWLQRAGALDDKARRVVVGMVEQIALIQDDVRRLLARLRPLGVTPSGVDDRPQTLGRLRSMLEDLVAGWSRSKAPGGTAIELVVDPQRDDEALPQELALALYRITQEAVTNVMRHAAAARCRVEVSVRGEPGSRVVAWRVSDDGRGIDDADAALRRGTGLAGLKERVWTLGGRFVLEPAGAGRGTRMRAEFPVADPAGP